MALERVVVVDDDALLRRALGRLLRDAGYDVATYSSAPEMLAAPDPPASACLVLDIHLGGMSGFELEEALRARGSSAPVVFISAEEEGAVRERLHAVRRGAYLRKPFDADSLLAAIRTAIAPNGAA